MLNFKILEFSKADIGLEPLFENINLSYGILRCDEIQTFF